MIRQIRSLATMASYTTSVYKDFFKNSKKVVGAGLNYNSLLKVNNAPTPQKPIIFLKPSTSYIQEGQDIVIPAGFTVFEEVELGVIIGKQCKHVTEADAMDYVAGYCVALDMTATSELTVARSTGLPWCIGKGFDTACPVSRFISKDEIADPHNVSLWLTVNGEKRQQGNTNDLIFSVPSLISFISKYFTLEPNDLILTGSPPGMGPVDHGDVLDAGIQDVVTIQYNVKREDA